MEADLLRREKELLIRENEMLRRMTELQTREQANETVRDNEGTKDSGQMIGNVRENDGVQMIEEAVDNDRRQMIGNTVCPKDSESAQESVAARADSFWSNLQQYGMLKEMLPEYDSGPGLDVWLAQVKSIRDVYKVDDHVLRTLMICRIKGKLWLHSKPNFQSQNIHQMIEEMQELFGTKKNKMEMRRKFENRKWKTNESFAEYLNEKLILSVGLGLEEDEFLEYAVEGIADDILRSQAYIQCFTTKSYLLQAFSKFQLKEQRPRAATSQQKLAVQEPAGSSRSQDREYRCFNCNSFGHYAAERKKPKQEYGAFYACGSMGHRAAVCPDRKKVVQLVEEDDEYVRSHYSSYSAHFTNHMPPFTD